jgi:hypothetical protein
VAERGVKEIAMSFLHKSLKVLGAVGLGAAAFDGLKYVGKGAAVAFDKLAGAGEAIDEETRDFLGGIGDRIGWGEANAPLSEEQKKKEKAKHDEWLAKNKDKPLWFKAGFKSQAEYDAAGKKIKAANPGAGAKGRPKREKRLKKAKEKRAQAAAVESAKRSELQTMRQRPKRMPQRPSRQGPPPTPSDPNYVEQMAWEEEGQTAQEIQSSRRLRQTSSELASQAELADQSGQYELADTLAEQSEQLAEAAIDPDEAEEMVKKSTISEIAKAAALSVLSAVKRKGGDNIEKLTDDIRDHGYVPDVEAYGDEQEYEDVSDVVSGWEDEHEDTVGTGCGCGCGGTCGCSTSDHNHDEHDHEHAAPPDLVRGAEPALRRGPVFAGPSWNRGPSWRFAGSAAPIEPIGGAPHPMRRKPNVGLGGCKTGKCWLPGGK